MKFGTGYSFWGTEWKCDYIEMVNRVADIGFDILEIGADHLYHMTEAEIAKLKAEGSKRGIAFTTNSGPAKQYDLSSADEAVRKNGILYFKDILHKMDLLGSESLVGAIYSYWPVDFSISDNDKEAAWERSIPCIKEIGDTAAELGIECALEVLNRNETYILTDCAEAVEYVKRTNSKGVKILLDTYHMNIEEDNMYDALRRAGDLLGHVHVGECNRKLPGMNNSINWPEIGKALRDINYQKAVVMEPFLLSGGDVGRDIRVWRDLSDNADEAQMTRYITDSLAYLKKCCEG